MADEPVEQRLTFGAVAEQYDRARPSYPDALFDAVMEYGGLQPGDAALEIGAGTGKATQHFVGRGLAVHALEPSPGMARVLRERGVDSEETTFEDWPSRDGAFRLVYAAQAWHWVHSSDRYEKAARALAPGGTLALFWNQGREWTGSLGDANDAAYAELAPNLTSSTRSWDLDDTLDQMTTAGTLCDITKRVVTWQQTYTTDEWVTLLGTHSDHRILPDEQRARLHAAVGRILDEHGGRVDMTYDANCYLAKRA